MHNIGTNVIKVLLNKFFFSKKSGYEDKKQNCFKKKPLFLVGLNNYIDICVINYVKSEKVFLHHLMYYKKIAKNYLTEI